jgi:hypothetical protein
MKIAPDPIRSRHSSDPVNQRPEAAPLKPLTDADFAQQLKAASGAMMSPQHGSLRPLTPSEMIPGVKGPVKDLMPFDPQRGVIAADKPLMELGDPQYQHIPSRAPKTEHDKIEETARKWVAQTFYGTMLKQMRESPFKSDLFAGGRGGQAFSSLLDQHLADHMSRAAGSKLVNAIARKLEARSGYQKQSSRSTIDSANPNLMRNHVAPGLRA